MGYYGMGDYYQGDPGIGSVFKAIARGAGKVGRIGGRFVPGLGTALDVGGFLVPKGRKGKGQAMVDAASRARGFVGKLRLPPGSQLPGVMAGPGGKFKKRRRMNPGNSKALRRAIRREKGFLKLAKSVLRGTGISISRRGVARAHHPHHGR